MTEHTACYPIQRSPGHQNFYHMLGLLPTMNVENVILLSVDGLRADHVPGLGYGRNTAPHIDELSRGEACFTNAYSASSYTREAVPSILTD